MEFENENGEYCYVHDFQIGQQKEMFDRTVGLTAGDAVNVLLLLILVTKRLLAKVGLSQRAHLQETKIGTFLRICPLIGSLPPAYLEDCTILIAGSTADELYLLEERLNCLPKHSINCFAIWSCFDKDGNKRFRFLSQSNFC